MDPAPTNVRQWLETAMTALRAVDAAWIEDASASPTADLPLDPQPSSHLADPARLRELREALQLVEGLLDDVIEADELNPGG